jgi:hypothetical protein
MTTGSFDIYYLVTSSTSVKSIHSSPVEAAAELQRLSGHEFEDVDNEALREWLDVPYTTFAALYNWIEPIRFAG